MKVLTDSGIKCGNCMLECNSNSLHFTQSPNQSERYTEMLETILYLFFLCFCPGYLFPLSNKMDSIFYNLPWFFQQLLYAYIKSFLSIACIFEGKEEILKGPFYVGRHHSLMQGSFAHIYMMIMINF